MGNFSIKRFAEELFIHEYKACIALNTLGTKSGYPH